MISYDWKPQSTGIVNNTELMGLHLLHIIHMLHMICVLHMFHMFQIFHMFHMFQMFHMFHNPVGMVRTLLLL